MPAGCVAHGGSAVMRCNHQQACWCDASLCPTVQVLLVVGCLMMCTTTRGTVRMLIRQPGTAVHQERLLNPSREKATPGPVRTKDIMAPHLNKWCVLTRTVCQQGERHRHDRASNSCGHQIFVLKPMCSTCSRVGVLVGPRLRQKLIRPQTTQLIC